MEVISVFYLAVQDQTYRKRYEELARIFPHAQFVAADTYAEAMVKAASKLLTTDYFFAVCDAHRVKHSITLVTNQLERVMMEPGALNERKDVLSYPSQAWPAAWDMIEKEPLPTDIIFISYDEANADENFGDLVSRFGEDRVKRVHGVKGIDKAHLEAAKLSTTDWFYVVDADNIIEPGFEFDFYPATAGDDKYVHIWMARNGMVPELTYGYGGVKLFRKQFLAGAGFSGLDFSTQVREVKYHDEVASTTHFNSDAFRAWRAAFRETCKLVKSGTPEALRRLELWRGLNIKQPCAGWALTGIEWGEQIAKGYADADVREMINDFDELFRFFKMIIHQYHYNAQAKNDVHLETT